MANTKPYFTEKENKTLYPRPIGYLPTEG